MYSLPLDFNLPTESVTSLTFKGVDRLGRAEVTLPMGTWVVTASATTTGTWVVFALATTTGKTWVVSASATTTGTQVVSASMQHQWQRLASFRSHDFPNAQLHVPARPFLLCLQPLHPRHSHMAVLRQQTTEAKPTLEPKWLRTYIYIYIYIYTYIYTHQNQGP